MAGLHLYDIAQGVAFVLVALLGLEAGEHLCGQGFAGFLRQAAAAVQLYSHAAVEERQHGAVDDCLAKLLDHVVDERGFAGAVGVEETGVGVQAGENQRPLDLAVEDSVAVVEGAVERIAGALGAASGPVHVGQEQFADGLPVFLGAAALDGEDLPAHVVHGVAANRIFERVGAQPVQFGDVVEDFVRQQAHLLVQVRLFCFAVFCHVFEQVDLVAQFALGRGQGHVQAAAVLAGLELRPPGLHGCGQAGAVEAADRFAAAVQEVDGHALLGAGGHGVAAEADAASGDQDGLQVHERRVAAFFAFAGHAQAPALLGDKAAELVHDQMLDDRHCGSSI